MEQEPNGVWLRDGNLIYMLEGTGQYFKGREVQQNKFSVSVIRDAVQPAAGTEALTARILALLQQDHTTPSGAELFAAARAAHQAFKTWLETTYPVGARVEFPYYGKKREGKVAGSGFDRADEPYLFIHHVKGSSRINPLAETVTALTAVTPQN